MGNVIDAVMALPLFESSSRRGDFSLSSSLLPNHLQRLTLFPLFSTHSNPFLLLLLCAPLVHPHHLTTNGLVLVHSPQHLFLTYFFFFLFLPRFLPSSSPRASSPSFPSLPRRFLQQVCSCCFPYQPRRRCLRDQQCVLPSASIPASG